MSFEVYDMEPPLISILSPQNKNYSTNIIWANVTLSEAGSWCGRNLDSSTNVSMTNSSGNWNDKMRNLTDGSHNIRFYCNDTVGNIGISNTIYFFSCLADVTGPNNTKDNKIDMRDIGYISNKFMTTPSSPNWDINADLNDDGVVNMRDIGIATSRFGKTCQ